MIASYYRNLTARQPHRGALYAHYTSHFNKCHLASEGLVNLMGDTGHKLESASITRQDVTTTLWPPFSKVVSPLRVKN